MGINLIEQIDEYIKTALKNDTSGHDYAHTKRVLENAMKIAQSYPAVDKEILIISCLLHDLSYKAGFVKDHHLVGAKLAEEYLHSIRYPEERISKIVIAIEDHVGNVSTPLRKPEELQIESKILRDADNIDALGEIGLKRAIEFNKNKNRQEIISLNDQFNDSLYGSVKGIITWADKMLTPEGKKIAYSQTEVMKEFLKQLEKKLNQT